MKNIKKEAEKYKREYEREWFKENEDWHSFEFLCCLHWGMLSDQSDILIAVIAVISGLTHKRGQMVNCALY